MIKNPYNDSYEISGVKIPIETAITLADGTEKPIEGISQGDRILTHAGSKSCVSVDQIPAHRPAKVQLIGFSELCNIPQV